MKKQTVAKLLLGAAAALLTTSCARWEDMSSFHTAAWSDDGNKIVVAKHYYEGKDTVTHIKERNHETELYLSNASNPNALSVLTPIVEGSVKSLFYMNTQGYIILGRMLEGVDVASGPTAGSTTREVIYEKVGLNGSMTEIDRVNEIAMLSCDGGQSATSVPGPLEIIPSPDGSVLAVVKTIADCTQQDQMTVSFRDADSLALTDGPTTVDVSALLSNNLPGPSLTGAFLLTGWSTDGKFLVTHAGNPDGAWAYAPGQAAEWRTGVDDGCVFPPTTSSDTNAQKQVLDVDYSDGISDPLTIKDASSDPWASSFGCP